MIWNQLTYELQKQVIETLIKSLETENDPMIQEGIMAAINELEVWSNSPIESNTPDEVENFVAHAHFVLDK